MYSMYNRIEYKIDAIFNHWLKDDNNNDNSMQFYFCIWEQNFNLYSNEFPYLEQRGIKSKYLLFLFGEHVILISIKTGSDNIFGQKPPTHPQNKSCLSILEESKNGVRLSWC